MNNYVLRRLRYALSLNDQMLLKIYALINYRLGLVELQSYLKKEDDASFVPLPDYLLIIFLDGLIMSKRGNQAGSVSLSQAERVALSKKSKLNNNIILNKIKIALSYTTDDLVSILKLADFRVSKSELSAFFRKSGHRNYRVCGNQLVRNLLTGLTLKFRDKQQSANEDKE